MNNLDINLLGKREIAGEVTGNAIINWIKHFTSVSAFLTTSPNAYGSIDLDLDFAQLANMIISLVGSIAADFKATVDGSRLTVEAGHIVLPSSTETIAQYTRNLSSGDDGVCVCLSSDTSDSTPSWAYELQPSVPSGIVSGSVVRLPVCVVSKSSDIWGVLQLHLGAFIFAVPPAPLISGYDGAEMQSLDHGVNGGLVWTTYGPCNQ